MATITRHLSNDVTAEQAVVDMLVTEAKSADRRAATRYPCFQAVQISGGDIVGASRGGFAREISASGIGLLHRYSIVPGRICVTVNDITGVNRDLPVEILWCRACGEGWYISGGRFAFTVTID